MPLNDAVSRYWNKHPISTDSVQFKRGSRGMFEAIYTRWIANGTPRREEFLASCQGKKVLEVGCGIAIDGRFLSEHDVDYQAVDISIESLMLATAHLRQQGLPVRFANADATVLPFADDTFDVVFSFGVLHHVPDTKAACREIARVLKPGGSLRVMLYGRRSYHYSLVTLVIYPLIWLLLHMPGGRFVAAKGPAKLRNMYEISRENGPDKKKLLNVSTDTSTPGEDNFNPHSSFYSETEAEKLFDGFQDFDFWKTDLRYFPFPFFRSKLEKYLGFFLHLTARKKTLP